MSAIGCRIKQRRTELNLSQQTIGDYVGVSRNAVSMWETGDSKGLRPESLVKTAEILKTTEKWLTFGTGDKELKGKDENPSLVKNDIYTIPHVQWEELVIILNSDNNGKEFKKMIISTLTKQVSSSSFAVLITSSEHLPYAKKGDSVVIDPDIPTLTKCCLVEMNGQYSFMRHILRDKEYLKPEAGSEICITDDLNYKIIGAVAFIQPQIREG